MNKEKCLNVDLMYDKDFKIFLKSSKRVCTRFLHDFIPALKKGNAQVVDFRDPKLVPPADKIKSPVLDVLTEMSNKILANVELQNEKQHFFANRSVYYGGRLLTDSLEQGNWYDQMYKTYVLALVDFIMFKEREHYYTPFALLCPDDVRLCLSDCLQFVFVEMGKFIRIYRSCDLADFIDRLDNRELWIYIIKRAPYLTAEHRKLIAARDEIMEEAMGILERMDRAKGPERILAEMKEKAWRDDQARKAYVFDQGREQGVQLGRKEGIEQGMQRGIEQGVLRGRKEGIEQGMQQGTEDTQRQFVVGLLDLMPPEQIAQRFGVPLEKVLEIQRQKNNK